MVESEDDWADTVGRNSSKTERGLCEELIPNA